MEDHKNCPLCAATFKTFGADYPSCAAIANEMTNDALNVLKARAKRLQDEAALKLKNGEITQEEHDLAADNAEFSMGFAAATLVATMTVDGPKMDPSKMMQLVEDKLSAVVTDVLRSLGVTPESLQEALSVTDFNMN